MLLNIEQLKLGQVPKLGLIIIETRPYYEHQ